MPEMRQLADAVIKGDQNAAVELTRGALDEGTAPEMVLNQGLVAGMEVVGQRFKKNEVFVPQVLIAARAMKMAMEILEPELVKAGVQPIGKFIIGTTQGDMHDIGKNLVAMMLKGAGFEVIDLGVDVAPETFLRQAKESEAHLVGISSLLTTTMPGMEKTVKAFKEVRSDVKIMVGGAPVTKDYADRIGADGYAEDAASAVDVAKSLIA